MRSSPAPAGTPGHRGLASDSCHMATLTVTTTLRSFRSWSTKVISRRMVKKQQMRWSPRGAHLLLQVRTRVLNNDLAGDFARWYPGLTTPGQLLDVAA